MTSYILVPKDKENEFKAEDFEETNDFISALDNLQEICDNLGLIGRYTYEPGIAGKEKYEIYSQNTGLWYDLLFGSIIVKNMKTGSISIKTNKEVEKEFYMIEG
jgi:hypothetical protein